MMHIVDEVLTRYFCIFNVYGRAIANLAERSLLPSPPASLLHLNQGGAPIPIIAQEHDKTSSSEIRMPIHHSTSTVLFADSMQAIYRL